MGLGVCGPLQTADVGRMSFTSRMPAVAGEPISRPIGISPTNSFLCCMCDLAVLNHTFRVGAVFYPELAGGRDGLSP